MFPLGQITFSAGVGVAVSVVALLLYQRLAKSDGPRGIGSSWPLAVVVGLSILAWRASGNTLTLNEDPIAFVSPNDVLCPVVTYVFVGVYGGFAGISGSPGWSRVRALLTVVSLVVNIVTI